MADVFCQRCRVNVGWTYVGAIVFSPLLLQPLSLGLVHQLRAFEIDQKYKENKFVLEKAHMAKILNEYDSTFLQLVQIDPAESNLSRDQDSVDSALVVTHPRGFRFAEARREMGRLLT